MPLPHQARKNPFVLHTSTITKNEKIGEGRAKAVVNTIITTREGKRLKLAAKVPRLPDLFTRQKFIREQQMWNKLKRIGLPVVPFSKLDLRKNSPTYLHIIQPNLERKYGKLINVHGERGEPVFLRKLNLYNDWRVIGEMASDLATMHNHHISPAFIDFWALYKKGNSYGRLIVDFEEIYDLNGGTHGLHEAAAHSCFFDLKKHFGKEELNYFIRRFVAELKDKKIGKEIANTFTQKPPSYYWKMHEKEKAKQQRENRSEGAKEGWKKRRNKD